MDRARKKAALTGSTSGVIAGIVAGIPMIAAFVALAASQDGDIWRALKGPAVVFLQGRALEPGFDLPAVLAGMLTHVTLSAAFGAAFGLLALGLSRPLTMIAGAVFGIFVFVLMFRVVLPLTGSTDVLAGIPDSPAAAVHVFYGLVLATAFLPFQRPALDSPGTGRPWWSVFAASRGGTRVDAH